MGYAVKKDLTGWRLVDSEKEILDSENYQESEPILKLDKQQNQETIKRLNQIDQETLRPLRSVYAGTDTAEDHAKLSALEEEAQQLRQELNNAN